MSTGGRTIEEILMPGGKPIGQRGTGRRVSAKVREVVGGRSEAERIFQELSQGGVDITPPGHPGTLVELPGGRERLVIGRHPRAAPRPSMSRLSMPTELRSQLKRSSFPTATGVMTDATETVFEEFMEECQDDHVGLW